MNPNAREETIVLGFSRKWNLDADMALNHIASYKRYMSEGNLMGANYAYTEIRRSVREQHRDKKLSEFAKLFKPIDEDLKSLFGDLEQLRAAHIEAELKQRLLMEKAREKAFAEEKKRREEEERFSVLTGEELDDAYFASIRENDTDMMRSLVSEAARRNGYLDTESNYQGEGAWAAPGNPGYGSDEERRADIENNNEINIEDIALGYSPQPDNYFTEPRMFGNDTLHGIESSNAILIAIGEIQIGKKDVKIKVYRAVPPEIKEGKIRNGDWVTPSREYAKMHGENRLEGNYRIIEQVVPANELWWDGNDVNEWGYDNGEAYRYRNIKNNRKLDDLITRDDEGHIIPLSKRFNPRKSDVRYFMSTETTLTEEETELRNTLITQLRNSGIDVITDIEKGQRILDIANDEIREHRKKKSANDTGLPENESLSKDAVVSFADTANIQQNLNQLAKSYIENDREYLKTFVSELGRALSATHQGSSSQYVTIEAKNGTVVTIRLANHNATTSKFDNAGRENAISIVISRKSNEGIINDGKAHVTEYFYPDKKLRSAGGKAMADIARSLSQTLYSGEYIDLTGLAEVQEVNPELLREHLVYHGSGADFEAFDHSHIGEGEGRQVYGWGTYVTEVEGIGRMYAEKTAIQPYISRINKLAFEIERKELFMISRKRDLRTIIDYDKYESKQRKQTKDLHSEYLKAKKIGDEKDMQFYQELIAGIEDEISPIHHKALVESFQNDIDKTQGEIIAMKSEISGLEREMKGLSKNLYLIEIPDEKEDNYLKWDAPAESLIEHLGVPRKIFDSYKMKSIEDVYSYLVVELGTDKAVSEYLSKKGYIGISYPAEHQSGGRADNARNYVIFNEKDAKIVDHIKFFQTETGNAYGFTMNDKIYIDPRVATAETPIHEYTHLWAEMIRRTAPKEWQNIVHLMKDTPQWNHVKRVYSFLHSDDEIAEEALAHFSGKRGVERLRKAQEEAIRKGHTTTAAAEIATEKVKEALSSFWNKVGSFFGLKKQKAEDIADRILLDMLKGVNPRFRQSIRYDIETRNGEQIRFHQENPLEEVNEQFNKQLKELTEENADHIIFSLGRPNLLLQSAGVEDKPMKLYGNKIIKKMKKHGFALNELQDLPRAVADPIAVFNNYRQEGNRSILTELRTEQGNFLVSLDLGKGIEDVDFNIITSVFGKNDNKIIEWINKGYSTYINKEKVLNYLHHSAPIAEALRNSRLLSATNIIKNFENPTLDRGKMEAVCKITGIELECETRIIKEKDIDNNHPKRKDGEKIKGWYDVEKDEVVIVIDNHISEEDVRATMFHEIIGHRGIRKYVGEDNFDKFLEKVYEKTTPDIQFEIDEIGWEYQISRTTATEEYIARLSERGFEKKHLSFIGQVKQLFTDLWNTTKIKLGFPITDKELLFMLEKTTRLARAKKLFHDFPKKDTSLRYRKEATAQSSKPKFFGNEISPEKYNKLQNGKLVTIKDFRLPNGTKKDVMIKKDPDKPSGFAFYEVPKPEKKQTGDKPVQKIKH